jgi:ribonuclease HIII
VLKVPPARHAALRDRIASGDFEFRPVPHSVFSVKGMGCVVTLYKSGKLVVQGAEPELFLARYTDLEVPAGSSSPAASDSVSILDGPLVGSDEAGKGDYFGPLVVAAVRLEPEQVAELRELGIADSKTLADPRALRLSALLRERVAHAVERLDPEEYKRVYPNYRGLNPMLAELHARAIRAVAKAGDRVLVDQFANEKVMKAALKGCDIRLEQATRAERNVAVAAASVLARAEFLLGLAELSSEFDVELRKGAGRPTDLAALEFARRHGVDALGRVAKLHFKNTGKLQGKLR